MLEPYSIPTATPSGLLLPQQLANSQAWHLPVESLCSTLRTNFQQVPTARHLSVFSAINKSHVCPPPHQVCIPGPGGSLGEVFLEQPVSALRVVAILLSAYW